MGLVEGASFPQGSELKFEFSLGEVPIPQVVWHSVAMDFIEGLPKSGGRDIIWVIIDRLSKYAHCLALSHPISAATLARVFIDQV